MVKPQFRQLDVESMRRRYEAKEQKHKNVVRLKHQCECGEQQQQQSPFPPVALPTPLESDAATLVATDNHTIGYMSGDFANFLDDNVSFNFVENFEMDDIAPIMESLVPPSKTGGIAAATRFFSSDEITSHAEFWSPCMSQRDQPPSQELGSSLPEELSLDSELVRRSTGQLRPKDCVMSDMDTDITEDKEKSEGGDTCEGCDDDRSANTDSSTRELAVPGPKLTSRDSSANTASHILYRSNPATSDSTGSPSSATSPVPSFSIDAPAAPLDRAEEPQRDVCALPTPSSDHAFVSQQCGDTITGRGKRGRGTNENGYESHDRRFPKRRRPRDTDSGTTSPALPARTLRALPSRVLVDKIAKRELTTQRGRKFRRSSRSQIRSRATGPVSSGPSGKDDSHLGGLPARNLDNASRREKHTAQREGSPTTPRFASPRLDHYSRNPSPQSAGRVSLPPVTTKTELFSATCHTCGFSTEHLLRMSDTVEALVGSGVEPSGGKRALDMLLLFIGFIRNYAAERLTRNAGIAEYNDSVNVMNWNYPKGATGGLSNAETVEDDETSHNSSRHDSDSESSSSFDHNESPDIPMGRVKRPPRRRWEPLEDARLRAWVQEGKEWTWMASRLDRSEQALIQHWAIIGKQDRKRAKR
ncbi:hypothetical protein CCHR01_18824 [Colletotrichum chrysophilum]|uniref:Myb-like domain-containing protein n=1 Tax=Colletotrichum chrysophilum TaxID=1836956 RepID=A0AAD9A1P9_9PEZI|nr:hypothetical protein CCHR01_18824 [Colletotrichum chrysophilum]